MDLKFKYYVNGYDKDGDVYENIAATPIKDFALAIGKALMHYHMGEEELRRSDNGEPFDWFVVTDGYGDIIETFTAESPSGTGE